MRRAVVLALAALSCLTWMMGAPPARAADLRLAVLEFGNASATHDMDPLGKGLQSMLTTDLSQVPALHLVERERLKDIQGEIKLGRSAMVDQATAVKMGKLLGATHLCSGTFAVVGEKMRIDARLLTVGTGEVLIAEQIEGDKGAFFELEKGLANKIVSAIGIRLQPKERAVMSKIHTADFDAFQRYSQGVAAFDDKRYQDALKAMQEASRLDKDFQLAALTLAEYERVIAQLRTRADATEAEKQVQRMAEAQQRAQKANSRWADKIQKLWQVAALKGGGQVQQDRIAAISLLAIGYDSRFQLQWNGGDHFALQRTRDELAKRYFAEAVPLFPRIPPLLYPHVWADPGRGGEGGRAPAQPDDVQGWVRAQWAKLEETMTLPHRRRDIAQYLSAQLQRYDEAAAQLQLTRAETMRLREQMARWIAQLDPKQAGVASSESFAELYRDQLELDRSTAILAELGRAEHDERALRRLASEIETNKKIADALSRSKMPALLREYLLLTPWQNGHQVVQTLFQGAHLDAEGLRYLQLARQMPRDGYVYLGDAPVWLVRSSRDEDVFTGPRTDKLRADEIRYYPNVAERRDNPGYDYTPEALLIIDGRPRSALRCRFQIRYTPAADFTTGDRSGRVVPDRPEVGFVFGVRDVSHGSDDNSQQVHGQALLFGPGGVRLAAFQKTTIKDERKVNNKRTELVTTVLEERKAALGKPERLAVEVRLGDEIEVRAGDRTLRFKAPAEREGFYGLVLQGMGYAAVGDIKISD